MKVSIWKDDDVKAYALEEWKDGKTASDVVQGIWRKFGVLTTRNAVIGLTSRHGLKKGFSRVAAARAGMRKQQQTKLQHKKRRAAAAAERKSAIVWRMPVEPLPAEDTPPARLHKLATWPETACKWVYTVDNEHFYGCTCEMVQGLSYCADHARRVFTAPEPIRRAPSRESRAKAIAAKEYVRAKMKEFA